VGRKKVKLGAVGIVGQIRLVGGGQSAHGMRQSTGCGAAAERGEKTSPVKGIQWHFSFSWYVFGGKATRISATSIRLRPALRLQPAVQK
jgi:hypothetical protein